MRIIYFEDDEIDKRLFLRACKNLQDLELVHYASHSDLSDTYINTYDGVILDQYLNDCTIKQFAEREINIPVAILSASSELVDIESATFIGIWQKPIKEEGIREILTSMNRECMDKISMVYIDDLTAGDEKERQELILDISKSLEQHLEKLNNQNIFDKDLLLQVHSLKSKVGIFYLEDLYGKIEKLETALRDNGDEKLAGLLINEVSARARKVLKQLKNKLDRNEGIDS